MKSTVLYINIGLLKLWVNKSKTMLCETYKNVSSKNVVFKLLFNLKLIVYIILSPINNSSFIEIYGALFTSIVQKIKFCHWVRYI